MSVMCLASKDLCLHFPQINDFLLLGLRIDFDNAERGADAQGTIENIHSKNDGLSFGKTSDDLETTWPHSLRGSVTTLGLHDLRIISGEGIEQMVNNIRYKSR